VLRQNRTFVHAAAFVLGFTLVFTLLGASVGLVGYVLYSYLPLVQKIGGVVLILFGLVTLGAFGWLSEQIEHRPSWRESAVGRAALIVLEWGMALTYTERRAQAPAVGRGYVASFLTGIFFSAGWVPCVGPILAAILLMASQLQTVAQGTALLFTYALGLGIPFLITGAAFSTMTGVLRRLNRYVGIVSWVSGLFLIFVGWLLFSDQLRLLAVGFQGALGTGLVAFESNLAAGAGVSLPIAFLAGLLSFFSPCVLPIIPGYIGYLSGAALAVSAAATAASSAASQSATTAAQR